MNFPYTRRPVPVFYPVTEFSTNKKTLDRNLSSKQNIKTILFCLFLAWHVRLKQYYVNNPQEQADGEEKSSKSKIESGSGSKIESGSGSEKENGHNKCLVKVFL